MKQAVFIHGGESFDTHEAYLDYLRSSSYEQGRREQRWKDVLPERLGEEWGVHMPSMPSPLNAKYLEWSIWFEKIIPLLEDDVVLIGHSLGGIFIAKYLSEHTLPVQVKAVFLVAAPFDTEDTDEYGLADFVLPVSLDGLKQARHIFLYHSEDDPIVPFADLAKFKSHLPDATVRVFAGRGHIMQPEFPELVADIQNLN